MRLKIKNLVLVLFCVLLLCIQVPGNVYAADASLTLHYVRDGVSFDIFFVATVNADNSYVPVGDFSSYSVEIPGSGWRDAAATLAAYADRDRITPMAAQYISGGTASFPGLTAGLYLIKGDVSAEDGTTYTPVPVLVTVPTEGITVDIKYDCDTGGEEELVACRVEKVWQQDKLSCGAR